MLKNTAKGLFFEPCNMYIDPIQAVDTAIITHAHADHAHWGIKHYIATAQTCDFLKERIGKHIKTTALNYHQSITKNSVTITLIPSGHILGSAHVVLEYKGYKTVITGDFKIQPDATTTPFQSTPCDLLVMETTFALPIYHWPKPQKVFKQIEQFFNSNKQNNQHTVLYAYSLGKAQRLIHYLNKSIGPIAVHSAIKKLNQIYLNHNHLNTDPPTLTNDLLQKWSTPGLIIAPPACINSKWIKRLKHYKEAYISGWMTSKGQIRRRNMAGFVLSDHADWAELNLAIKQFSPKNVWTMHGYTTLFAKYLNQQGINAQPINQTIPQTES